MSCASRSLVRSSACESAVDREASPSHHRASGGEEEDNCPRHFLRRADPPHRERRVLLRLPLRPPLREPLHHRGVRRRRADRVDPHAARRVLPRGGAREADDRMLRRRVRRELRHRRVRRGGREVDDAVVERVDRRAAPPRVPRRLRAAAVRRGLPQHLTDLRAEAQEGAARVHAHHGVEVRGVELVELGALALDARRVEGAVEPAESRGTQPHHRLD
mmetsp:Transcript_31214/g.77835  ORF Transcript_31214/g.77835 Transcript_31214/m.77835 type:complete len:218 (+) Transcript_31214:219-872(+)